MISCISLADDAVLVSNEIYDLQNLIHLTELYCKKYGVELVIDKTKLLTFSKRNDARVTYAKNTASVKLNGEQIPFSEEVEHLGVLRSSGPGNTVSVMNRISAYRRQIYSLLPAGLASHHHCNPAASLKVEQLYCLPVLLSGITTLVLNKSELNMIVNYRKNTLARLMKLPDATPDPVVYFLSGSLPTAAYVHLRQLSLFAMICNLDDNILKDHARNILTTHNTKSSNSWFFTIRDICVTYMLPQPLTMLSGPFPKTQFKKLCKSKIHDYWH